MCGEGQVPAPRLLSHTPRESKSGVSYPFGICFANATKLYVADDGNGTVGKTVAGEGLGEWTLAYTLTNGLNLGTPYDVPNSPNGDVYPTGLNDGAGGTGFPWAPATDGLRNITGAVNSDGTATI